MRSLLRRLQGMAQPEQQQRLQRRPTDCKGEPDCACEPNLRQSCEGKPNYTGQGSGRSSSQRAERLELEHLLSCSVWRPVRPKNNTSHFRLAMHTTPQCTIKRSDSGLTSAMTDLPTSPKPKPLRSGLVQFVRYHSTPRPRHSASTLGQHHDPILHHPHPTHRRIYP